MFQNILFCDTVKFFFGRSLACTAHFESTLLKSQTCIWLKSTVGLIKDKLSHFFTFCSLHLLRYDNYGRLTNVTYPTGRVSSYHTDSDSTVRVQTEGSNKEDITVTTNLSASGTFYTLMQGKNICKALIEHILGDSSWELGKVLA